MKILIDTDELVEFFGEGWCSCDISTKEELKSFLVDFCKQKIEGEEKEEEKEEPAKSETCPKIDSITYFTRDQAQKHLQLLMKRQHEAHEAKKEPPVTLAESSDSPAGGSRL